MYVRGEDIQTTKAGRAQDAAFWVDSLLATPKAGPAQDGALGVGLGKCALNQSAAHHSLSIRLAPFSLQVASVSEALRAAPIVAADVPHSPGTDQPPLSRLIERNHRSHGSRLSG